VIEEKEALLFVNKKKQKNFAPAGCGAVQLIPDPTTVMAAKAVIHVLPARERRLSPSHCQP
jgi:hypothetical protein